MKAGGKAPARAGCSVGPSGDQGPRLSALEPDTSCWNHLNWRCSVRGAYEVEALEARLTERGLAVRCRHAALRIFRHPDGHEIALVLTTGRVQLRVDIGQPEDQRTQVAHALHGTLSEALEGRGEGQDPAKGQGQA